MVSIEKNDNHGFLTTLRVGVWWKLLALIGFAWAAAGFVNFAYLYSNAPSLPGYEHCYCFSNDVWAQIVFPSMLHLEPGAIVMSRLPAECPPPTPPPGREERHRSSILDRSAFAVSQSPTALFSQLRQYRANLRWIPLVIPADLKRL